MKPVSLAQAVARYLHYRTQFGFQLDHDRLYLQSLVRFARARHHRGALTVKLMVAWAQQACRSNRPQQHARRLELVGRFAKFWVTFDPRTEVPPAGLLGSAYSARPPVHIYTPRQITRLLAMTRHLHGAHPWWTLTFKTIFGLLAATGMRLGEVIRLQDRDVDWSAGELTVRQGKSGRPRQLPLHATTQQALRRYRQARQKCQPGSGLTFFVQPHGQPLKSWQVRDGFRYARQRLGWQAWRPRPRLHDLRHTFAVHCLLRWQGQRALFHHRMEALAAYLGHRRMEYTYWYCTAVPVLMKQTQRRWQQACRKGGWHHVH